MPGAPIGPHPSGYGPDCEEVDVHPEQEKQKAPRNAVEALTAAPAPWDH